MKKKIGIVYSSFNNYDLMEHEVIKRVDFENYPVINIDDKSSHEEQKKGEQICRKNGIYFEINKNKGLQSAVNQGIDFLKKKFDTEWIICLQQDIYPLTPNFFSKFEKLIENINSEHQIGAIGFNILSDDGLYMKKDILEKYHNGNKVNGLLGVLPLSGPKNSFYKLSFKHKLKYLIYTLINNNSNFEKKNLLFAEARNFCEYSVKNFNKIVDSYNGLCSIDIPMWAAIAININKWKNYVTIRKEYIFHIWFVDIAFQLMQNNIHLAVYTDLHMKNKQRIKEKYGYHWSSAHAGRDPNNKQVEKYGNHLKIFKKFWGFDYNKIFKEYDKVKHNYKDTLIQKMWEHDYRAGPLKKFL